MDQEQKKYKPTKEQQPVTPLKAPFFLPNLTLRENQVADLVLRGAPYPEMARELGISRRTVKAYMNQLFEIFSVPMCTHPRVVLATRLQLLQKS